MDNNYLEHYGILGMKWGVRRTEAQLARAQGRVDKLKAKKKEAVRLERAKKKLNAAKQEEQNLKSFLSKKDKSNKPAKDSSNLKTKKKQISELSETELRERITRMELEKRYKDLVSSANPPKSKKGQNFVSGVLENSGKNIATQFTTYVLGKGVNKVFKDIFDDDSIVNPKKGQKDK